MSALIPDAVVEACVRDHDRRDATCEYCAVRATWQQCQGCDARWEDGTQVTGPTDHDHVICSDWWDEILCPVAVKVGALADPRRPGERCGDPVKPGAGFCSFHQRIADADECGRIYQRLVAVR